MEKFPSLIPNQANLLLPVDPPLAGKHQPDRVSYKTTVSEQIVSVCCSTVCVNSLMSFMVWHRDPVQDLHWTCQVRRAQRLSLAWSSSCWAVGTVVFILVGMDHNQKAWEPIYLDARMDQP